MLTPVEVTLLALLILIEAVNLAFAIYILRTKRV